MSAEPYVSGLENGQSVSGREKIILTAERLFALHGIGGVSLRRINIEAGQKNTGAAHYYFQSKKGLLESIVDYRMSIVDGIRLSIINELYVDGRIPNLREAVRCIIQPLMREICIISDESYYLRFIERLFREVQFGATDIAIARREGLEIVVAAIERFLPHLPSEIVEFRMAMLRDHTVSSLATLEARARALGIPKAQAYAEDLVDVLVAGLSAPISKDTIGRLR